MEGFTCEAFPDGIPDGIIDNQADHRRTIEGDNGIRFVAVREPPVSLLERLDELED